MLPCEMLEAAKHKMHVKETIKTPVGINRDWTWHHMFPYMLNMNCPHVPNRFHLLLIVQQQNIQPRGYWNKGTVVNEISRGCVLQSCVHGAGGGGAGLWAPGRGCEEQQQLRGPELLAGRPGSSSSSHTASHRAAFVSRGCWSPCDQSCHSLFGKRTRAAGVTRGRDRGPRGSVGVGDIDDWLHSLCSDWSNLVSVTTTAHTHVDNRGGGGGSVPLLLCWILPHYVTGHGYLHSNSCWRISLVNCSYCFQPENTGVTRGGFPYKYQ